MFSGPRKRTLTYVFQILEDNECQVRLKYPEKLFTIFEGE